MISFLKNIIPKQIMEKCPCYVGEGSPCRNN